MFTFGDQNVRLEVPMLFITLASVEMIVAILWKRVRSNDCAVRLT